MLSQIKLEMGFEACWSQDQRNSKRCLINQIWLEILVEITPSHFASQQIWYQWKAKVGVFLPELSSSSMEIKKKITANGVSTMDIEHNSNKQPNIDLHLVSDLLL